MNFGACTTSNDKILNSRTMDIFFSVHNLRFNIFEFNWYTSGLNILEKNITFTAENYGTYKVKFIT